jgi:hypothetical protein
MLQSRLRYVPRHGIAESGSSYGKVVPSEFR